jgi:hypothetical protein
VPPPCGLDESGGDPVCFGACASGQLCAFVPDGNGGGCECRPFNDFCQPNGQICGGFCDAPNRTCVPVDVGGSLGCRCDRVE